MNEFEQELYNNGFSAKDIGKLKSIIKKDESKKIHYKASLLI